MHRGFLHKVFGIGPQQPHKNEFYKHNNPTAITACVWSCRLVLFPSYLATKSVNHVNRVNL